MLLVQDRIFLNKLEDLISNLVNEHKANIRRLGKGVYNIRKENNNIDKILSDVESLLSNRFGILFRLLPSDSYAVYPYSGALSDDEFMKSVQTSKDIISYIDEINNYVINKGLKDGDLTKIKNITDLDRYPELSTMFKMFRDFNTLILSGGIKIDAKTFKVTGLIEKQKSRKAPTIIMYSVPEIQSNKITIREHIASLLHEIGHQINTIKYAMLVDVKDYSLVNAIFDNKPNTKEGFEKILLKETSTKDIDLETIIDIVKKQRSSFESMLTKYTDNILVESVADELPTALGYGPDLAKNLNRLGDTSLRGPSNSFNTFMGLFFIFMYMYSLFAIIITFIVNSILGTLIFGLNIIATTIIELFINLFTVQLFKLIGMLFLHSNMKKIKDKPHEDYFERVRRMRQQLIRDLRVNENIPKQQKAQIISQILKLESLTKDLEYDKTVDSVIAKLIFAEITPYAYKELLSRLRTLIDNNLYTQSNRLEQLL